MATTIFGRQGVTLDRSWNEQDPPAAVYLYNPDRKAEHPVTHLPTFSGIVQVEGYPGFDRLRDGGVIRLADCWAHARRKFYEVQQATAWVKLDDYSVFERSGDRFA